MSRSLLEYLKQKGSRNEKALALAGRSTSVTGYYFLDGFTAYIGEWRMKGIISVVQVSIWCSNCAESYVDAHLTQKQAINDARKEGWSIGNKVLCPKCRKQKRVK